jgi:hypothetical protein
MRSFKAKIQSLLQAFLRRLQGCKGSLVKVCGSPNGLHELGFLFLPQEKSHFGLQLWLQQIILSEL